MAKIEGEPVLDSDQEEIALSDSELDNVLKSADITDEDSEEEQSDLEQYGVWVKVEPHDIEEEAERNMSFELSDLDSSGESALTEEEEQLLGELEDDEESGLGDLSGLEDDLEELGKGNAFGEQGEEEELSVEDLDVGLEELGEGGLEDTSDLDEFADIGEEEALSLEMEPEADIEVPLSDSAIVEEHYEDLATVEGVPSTPGQAPPKGSSDILEKIERDLNQIKTEIQNLKNELAGLGKAGAAAGKVEVAPAPSGDEGFFEKGEEETIALTGDELDNILNTADVTEEVELPEESVEIPEAEELSDQELAALVEEPELPGGTEEEIMELGSLDLEPEEAVSEATDLEESELSLEELEPSEADEESIKIDIGGNASEEQLSELDELGELPSEEPPEDLDLEELEELDLEEPDLEEAKASEELSELDELGELRSEEPAGDLELEELDELGEIGELPELPSEESAAEQPAEELEELDLEESDLEELSLEEPEELDLEELDLEETGLEELSEPGEPGPEEPLEELSAEEPSAEQPLEEPSELSEPGEPSSEEPDLAPEELGIQEAEPEEVEIPQAGSDVLSEDLRSEIKSILSYFDQLLEDLPEAKIKEFAQSEYFVRYQRLFKELGLGA